MEHGFTVVTCRVCEDPPCVRACPMSALARTEKRGIHLTEEKCTGCGSCVDACVVGAVFWDNEISKPMICIQCGFCVDFCPHGVIDMEGKKGGRSCKVAIRSVNILYVDLTRKRFRVETETGSF